MPTKIVTVGTSEVTLVERNDERTGLMIFNLTETKAAAAGNAVIYISDEAGVTTTNGYAIPPKGFIIIDFSEGFDPRKKYYVISSTATTFVTVFEEFLKERKKIVEEPVKEDVQEIPRADAPM